MDLTFNTQERENIESYASENSFRNFHTVGLRDLEHRLIHQFFNQHGSRVLDIGCGYGRTTKPLHDLGYNVIGIDVVLRMIETARKEFQGIDFQFMSATDLAFASESFDYALFSYNGIDYIYPEEKRNKALKEIFRILKPGGKIILTSHNSATLVTRPRHTIFRTLWRTFQQGLMFSSYVVAPFEGGDLVTFCRLPWLQERDFRSVGFNIVSVVGKSHRNSLMINLFESWPYFVLQKPL